MRTFTLTPTPEHKIVDPGVRHQLVIHRDHISDVVPLTDAEFAQLCRVVDQYRPQVIDHRYDAGWPRDDSRGCIVPVTCGRPGSEHARSEYPPAEGDLP